MVNMDIILNELQAPHGTSPYSLYLNVSSWDLTQLWSPRTFQWKVGTTPMADLQVILISWILYFVAVVGLKIYMRNRPPFKLKWITAIHNIILCLWSLGMCLSAAVEIYKRATALGVDEVFCTVDTKNLKGPLFFTLYTYYISKFYELLDTVILVLKKKPLIFLHWYHHAIVILMVWTWLEFGILYASLGMFANTLIHVFMYYYYYASSLGQNVWYKRYITTGQIIQFMTSFALCVPYLYFHFKKGCSGWEAFLFSMTINGTFLLLFIDFYRRSYLTKKKADAKDKKKNAVPPKVTFGGKIVPVDLESSNRGVLTFPGESIIPEALNDKLVTPYLSITLMNANVLRQYVPPETEMMKGAYAELGHTMLNGTKPETLGTSSEAGFVQVMGVRAKSLDGSKIDAYIPVIFSLKLAPGQIYPLPVAIEPEEDKAPSIISIEIDLIYLDTMEPFTIDAGPYEIKRKSWGETYKITFLDFDSIVHYAMARPPSEPCVPRKGCPIVLALHGAGVEASMPFWTEAFQRQKYAWLLFPTGRTPWGFDWHGPSFRNVETAVVTLSHMHSVPDVYTDTYGADENKLVYTGHSNGGQGAWWFTSHHPDKALAAVPASGYLKIQLYIPYIMRVGDAFADPILRGIMEASIAENDLDIYAANMAGVPILARTGGNDDNLEVPYRLATIRVQQVNHGTKWILNTTNVRRFGFSKDERTQIESWSIDGQDFVDAPKVGPSYLRSEIDGNYVWTLTPDLLWISEERYSSTYGSASQIFNHPFLIVVPSSPSVIEAAVYRRAAQYLATSWYLYGRGGTQIVQDTDVRDGITAKYNLIVLGGSKDNLFSKRREKEVKFLDSGGFQIEKKRYEAPGTGILFLAPSPTRTLLGLYIAGIDDDGFQRALWSLPFRTGLLVPDYLVVGNEYGDPATGWTAGDGHPSGGAGTKGLGGVLAAGFWGNDWNYDPNCGYLKTS
ncbi:hypothetical protein HDV05_007484 [Chytridiales sp. JEL 0842]|nr:hypothetical protein HDV05_007484 [Chytridiales sp. JEL 0842]